MFFLRILRPTTKIAAKLALHPLGTRSRFQPLLIIYTMSKTISRTSSKRKLEEDEMDTASPSTSSQTKKKQKAPLKKSEPTLPDTKSAIEEDSQKTLVGRDATEQPKNTKLPDIITFPPPTPGCVKIAAWNVAGMKACQGKGFQRYVQAEDPDILILNETKLNNVPVDPFIDGRYPHRYWNIAVKKGYAGTAIFSKHKPLSVSYILPDTSTDLTKGRLVILEFDSIWLIGTYVPNAGVNLKSMDVKVAWQNAFEKQLRALDATKPLIWAGDVNVAPTAKDLRNDKSNWNKTAGFTAIECNAFARMLDPSLGTKSEEAEDSTAKAPGKLIDAWRAMHPKDEHYSYFSYRFNARGKGMGWRIDNCVVSERLFDRVKTCEIRSEIWGASDHCPLVFELEGDL